MNLKNYLLEYVSSGRNRLNKFPVDAVYSDDKDSIISWLESNGFKRVPDVYLGSVMSPSEVIVISEKFGPKIYNYGDFKKDRGTHWIQFGDKRWMFFLRTGDGYDYFLDKMAGISSMGIEDMESDKGRSKITDIREFIDQIYDKLI
jgi:hypothetical protein